nr:hypothetical protein [Pedobacter lusitanus]
MAYQILEDNLNEKEIVLAGIWDRGYKLALRLKKSFTGNIRPYGYHA